MKDENDKSRIPKKYLECLYCDFSTSTVCGWYTCDEHEEEYNKWEMKWHESNKLRNLR